LLPGSRTQEVERNLPTLLGAAETIHQQRPDTRFLVACYREGHRRHIDARLQGSGLPIHTFVGRTQEIIHLAEACVTVSGSVSLELVCRGSPSVVVSHVGRLWWWLARKTRFIKVPYITLVNLLGGKELFPEYPTGRGKAEVVAAHVLRWLNEPAEREAL